MSLAEKGNSKRKSKKEATTKIANIRRSFARTGKDTETATLDAT
jgi:hypothetical protein